ncbi:hypothetical protein VTN49DRAFT_2007 [Thermomyces lanuginosus]|uniref:uncharacterized protein n=1 Tax=Thermomyces lanuginosus TaxID=5541 RepID=UPI0037448558
MVQGAVKKQKASASSKPTSKIGPRSITPKKSKLIKKHKMNKKITAGLIAKTEEQLAKRAGHLELLAKERKEKMKEKRPQYKKK